MIKPGCCEKSFLADWVLISLGVKYEECKILF